MVSCYFRVFYRLLALSLYSVPIECFFHSDLIFYTLMRMTASVAPMTCISMKCVLFSLYAYSLPLGTGIWHLYFVIEDLCCYFFVFVLKIACYFVWISTPPRVYRQAASLVGLQLVTSFISVAKILGGQRETTQRQLNAEKKKRNDGPRIESLNKRLTLTHEKITTTEGMMRKIFTG